MLDEIVVMGLVVGLTEALKHYTKWPKRLVWVPVILLSAGLSALNAWVFTGGDVRAAVADGIKMGALASGVYGWGKAALGKS